VCVFGVAFFITLAGLVLAAARRQWPAVESGKLASPEDFRQAVFAFSVFLLASFPLFYGYILWGSLIDSGDDDDVSDGLGLAALAVPTILALGALA
jgi:hypothetical protein